MARKATPAKPKKGGVTKKRAKAAPRKTAASARSRKAAPALARPSSERSAADALVKLIESPLVADLLAVGATAALAAIAEQGFGRRTDEGRRSTKALKAAGKAAAAAMGRRLSTEFEEIRKAADKAKAGGGAKA